PKSMYRLLQGDVGSGKTIVALISMLATVSAGYQSAIMAPTDILARQHFETITKLVKPFKLKVTLLVGSLSSSERKEALTSISNGESQIIIGTHALIQESVHYQKLGLCVIDEQHRFGVEQRKMLHEKGDEVELLLMSATPIPRTLAIAIFQDLDVSSLLVPPITSKDVKTKLILGSSINAIIPNMKATLKRGEKIYVVCSLIENELSDYQNVTKIYQEMKAKFGAICPVLLLHGKLKEEEKIKVMADFVDSASAILVSTTVIEVGLDVKTATMMIVYDANCFGLAQLHQLRGRIGRGGQSSTCYLLDNSGDEEATKRLNFLVNNNDGFEIARYDLALRGPGDIAGYSQSGELNFMMCDIFQDYKIFEYAKEDAKAILKASFDSKNQPILAFLAEQMAKDVAVIE
ncbi:MAG: helicase-related protein, partial [Bacilli bacterium]|nr:helicase-related protein [Bacilli bacterium]